MFANAQHNLKRIVPGFVRSNDPFGRYIREDAQPVRQLDATAQSYVEQVKRTREMLRSLDPEKVKQVIEFHKKLNFFEALALAQRGGKLIVPNDVHDRILTKTKDHVYLRANYPVWAGTLIIYEGPNKPFRGEVIFSWEHNKVQYSISFQIPKQFRGLTNCALIVEHSDFELINLKDNKYELKLLEGANIRLIENFPRKNDWYDPDPETKIPQGEPVRDSKEARHLWRSYKAYLGPVARVYDDSGYDNGRSVSLYGRPSGLLRVALVDVGRDANVAAATLRPLSEGQSEATAPEKSDSHE